MQIETATEKCAEKKEKKLAEKVSGKKTE